MCHSCECGVSRKVMCFHLEGKLLFGLPLFSYYDYNYTLYLGTCWTCYNSLASLESPLCRPH